ncbi:MAG: hypothetical protein M0Z52_04440 [Actinomycetota bacterium]|nr:hypothetical protein [Actinomycetota bacterium]
MKAKAAIGEFRLATPAASDTPIELPAPTAARPSLQFKSIFYYGMGYKELEEAVGILGNIPGGNVPENQAEPPSITNSAAGAGYLDSSAGAPDSQHRFSGAVITSGSQGPEFDILFRNQTDLRPGLNQPYTPYTANNEPDFWGRSASKTKVIKGIGSVFYNLSGNYSLPEGAKMNPGKRLYTFNAITRFTTRQFDKTTAGIQIQGGYLPGNFIPAGITLFANSNPLKKLNISGKYSLNITYNGLSPWSRYMPSTNYNDLITAAASYHLTPKFDLTGSVTKNGNSASRLSQYVYEGGMAWRPSPAASTNLTLRLTEFGPLKAYELLAGYNQKFSNTSNLAFNTDFRQDWCGLSHGRVDMSYAMVKGKIIITPSAGAGMDEVSRTRNLYSWNVMLKITAPIGIF